MPFEKEIIIRDVKYFADGKVKEGNIFIKNDKIS